MAKKDSIKKKKEKVSMKEFRREVQAKLSAALASYKQEMGEKKFQTRIKEASKLFSRKLKKVLKKNDTKALTPKPVNMDGIYRQETVPV